MSLTYDTHADEPPAIYIKLGGYKFFRMLAITESGPFYDERQAFNSCVGLIELALDTNRQPNVKIDACLSG